jgi:ketosteroid isomerase-like protein
MKTSVWSALVLVVLTAACAQPAPPPPPAPPPGPDLAAEERAIRETDGRWLKAAQARDAAGEAAMLAADAVMFRPHVEPLAGPAAFQAYIEKENAANPKAAPNWTTDTITVARSGDMAVQTGSYHIKSLGPKGAGEDRGRFVTVWKKIGSDWKVAHDIGTSTMPEPARK